MCQCDDGPDCGTCWECVEGCCVSCWCWDDGAPISGSIDAPATCALCEQVMFGADVNDYDHWVSGWGYEQYPTYQHADYALHMISRMWEKLQEQELATESQAWPMIIQASQTLLNRYPRSQYAPIARKTLDWITATENRRKEQAYEQH